MEINKLYGFVFLIIMVGMVLGAGILAVDKLGIAAKDDTTVTEENITITSGAGQTANDDVDSVTFFGNGSVNSSDSTITIGNNVAGVAVNWTSAGVLDVTSVNFSNGVYKISYTYDADTATTTATGNVNTELGTIASTWLGLIITIAILAIIIVLVVKSFGGNR